MIPKGRVASGAGWQASSLRAEPMAQFPLPGARKTYTIGWNP